MSKLPALTIISLALAGVICGCISPTRWSINAREAAAKLAVAKRDLIVLPSYPCSPGSAFPISSRNAITAAHSFPGDFNLSSVAGVLMSIIVPDQEATLSGLPDERDWIDMHGTTDRFVPNIIDCNVALNRGDVVFLGGFRGHREPYNALWHATRDPEVVVGHVYAPRYSDGGPCVVQVEVPDGDYLGFSGGPAAIVDQNDTVRVWGSIVGGKRVVESVIPWRMRFVARVARLPKDHLEQISKLKLLNPTQYPDSMKQPGQIRH